jgi:hypothetical protein
VSLVRRPNMPLSGRVLACDTACPSMPPTASGPPQAIVRLSDLQLGALRASVPGFPAGSVLDLSIETARFGAQLKEFTGGSVVLLRVAPSVQVDDSPVGAGLFQAVDGCFAVRWLRTDDLSEARSAAQEQERQLLAAGQADGEDVGDAVATMRAVDRAVGLRAPRMGTIPQYAGEARAAQSWLKATAEALDKQVEKLGVPMDLYRSIGALSTPEESVLTPNPSRVLAAFESAFDRTHAEVLQALGGGASRRSESGALVRTAESPIAGCKAAARQLEGFKTPKRIASPVQLAAEPAEQAELPVACSPRVTANALELEELGVPSSAVQVLAQSCVNAGTIRTSSWRGATDAHRSRRPSQRD